MTPYTLFLPHGAPDLAISDVPARRFLEELGAGLAPSVRGIIMVSAHWESDRPALTSATHPQTVHDFGGFAPELHTMRYPGRTDPGLVDAVEAALRAAGFEPTLDPAAGFDHGAWVPLRLMLPDARLPVVQLSLLRDASPARQLELGAALAPLAAAGWLVVGSGSMVHNLRAMTPEGSPVPDWAARFDAWVADALESGDIDALLEPANSPDFARSHPTPEHLMPLYVALGAAGPGACPTRLHDSWTYGSVGMAAWRFDASAAAAAA